LTANKVKKFLSAGSHVKMEYILTQTTITKQFTECLRCES